MIEVRTYYGARLLCVERLCYANLHHADLQSAALNNADVHGANLANANLRDADLCGANLANANLRGADLRGADLRGADLRATDLRGADLRETHGIICLGTDPRGYHFIGVKHTKTWYVAAGCRWFTYAEALRHWHNNPDALARVAILAAHMATL